MCQKLDLDLKNSCLPFGIPLKANLEEGALKHPSINLEIIYFVFPAPKMIDSHPLTKFKKWVFFGSQRVD